MQLLQLKPTPTAAFCAAGSCPSSFAINWCGGITVGSWTFFFPESFVGHDSQLDGVKTVNKWWCLIKTLFPLAWQNVFCLVRINASDYDICSHLHIVFQLSIGWNLDPLHFWPNNAVMCSTLKCHAATRQKWRIHWRQLRTVSCVETRKTLETSKTREMLVLPRLMLLALGEGSPPKQCKLKSFHGLRNLCSLHITPASSLALTCTMSSVLLVDCH